MSKVHINYKSGISVYVECDNFSIKYTAAGLVSVEWENAKPDPMFINIDAIESIWEY